MSLIFSLIARVIIPSNVVRSIIGISCGIFAIIMMVGILINTIMGLWKMFRRSLYGYDAYITNTLPIERKTLYLSKVLTSTIVLLASILIIFLSVYIISYDTFAVENDIISSIHYIYGNNIMLLFFLFLVFINVVQSGYTGIIIGHQKSNSQNQFSILFGMITYIISLFIVFLVIFIAALLNTNIMNLLIINDINFLYIKIVVRIIFIVNVFILTLGYFINVKQLKKGVNVE